jgi:lysozyme
MAAEMRPLVVDLSHHNAVTDWSRIVGAGICGVIHKATEGLLYVDPTYHPRRAQAQAAGLLWGAYHFATGSDPERQAEHFVATVEASGGYEGVLLALDWEENPNAGGTMSLDQAKAFLAYVYDRTGQIPVLYSGNLIKEALSKAGYAQGNAFLSGHRLWLAQYGPKAALPAGFKSCFLWQYTGDGIGPEPHSVDGIDGTGLDLNVYSGPEEELKQEWAPAPSKVIAAEAGLQPASRAEPAAALELPSAPAGSSGEAGADLVSAKKPGILRTVAGSKSLVAILIAALFKGVAALTQWLDDLWDLIQWAVGALPDITSDVRTTLTSGKEVAEWFKIDWASISTVVVGVVIVVWFLRHLADKRELEAHRRAAAASAAAGSIPAPA